MLFSPRFGLVMQPLDVLLELLAIDTPDPAAPDLDRRQLAVSNERVGLLAAHVEVRGNVVEGEKTRLGRAFSALGSADHPVSLAPKPLNSLVLTPFAFTKEEPCN